MAVKQTRVGSPDAKATLFRILSTIEDMSTIMYKVIMYLSIVSSKVALFLLQKQVVCNRFYANIYSTQPT
jgi:hypothetical protein